MKGLLKKFRGNKKGFTLAELLVVVAIVAILVAISVPIFTTQLGKARKATNQANLRAAKVAAVAQYLTDGYDGDEITYIYNIEDGVAAKAQATYEPGNQLNLVTVDGASSTTRYKDIAVTVKTADSTATTKEANVVTLYAK